VLAEGDGGELAADAGGVSGAVEGQDGCSGYAQPPLESLDELLELRELSGSGWGLVEVTDKADADVIVGGARELREGLFVAEYAGGLLYSPSLADLDLAVLGAVAVADEEMVEDSAGTLADGEGVAAGGLGVMDVDVLPASGADGSIGVEDQIEGAVLVEHDEAAGGVGSEGSGSESEQEHAGDCERGQEGGKHHGIPPRLGAIAGGRMVGGLAGSATAVTHGCILFLEECVRVSQICGIGTA